MKLHLANPLRHTKNVHLELLILQKCPIVNIPKNNKNTMTISVCLFHISFYALLNNCKQFRQLTAKRDVVRPLCLQL